MVRSETPIDAFFFSGTAILKGRKASRVALLLLACCSLRATAGKIPAGFTEHFADVNNVRLHYFIGGNGTSVVLLHGYAETSHLWLPLMPQLAERHTVIIPDLRGAGQSSYFRNFERDAKDFAALSATPLPMPVLVLTGEKASGNFFIEQARLVASNVCRQIVPGSGHWLMEEAPNKVIPALTAFLNSEP